MKIIVALLIVLMVALHQDFWLWTDRRLIFGFLPVGLAYHMGYAFLASLVMWVLVKVAWPKETEQAAPADRAGEERG